MNETLDNLNQEAYNLGSADYFASIYGTLETQINFNNSLNIGNNLSQLFYQTNFHEFLQKNSIAMEKYLQGYANAVRNSEKSLKKINFYRQRYNSVTLNEQQAERLLLILKN